MTSLSLNLFSEDIGFKDIEFFEATNSKSKKDFFFEGIFAQADIVNGNSRVYPSNILMPAVEQYIKSRVDRKLGLGELDHPDTLTVSSKNASHMITELKIEGSNVYGKAKMLNTPAGKIARQLAEDGVQLTVSTRGLGRSKKKNRVEHMNMFVLTAVDLVSFPSAPDAFVNGMMENAEFLVESNLISIDTADKMVNHKNMTEGEFRALLKRVTSDIKHSNMEL